MVARQYFSMSEAEMGEIFVFFVWYEDLSRAASVLMDRDLSYYTNVQKMVGRYSLVYAQKAPANRFS